jgi:H+/Cl- antiporter ClcA
MGALAVGLAKLVAIILANSAGFPGGVIFPLFFAAAALAQGGLTDLLAAFAPGLKHDKVTQ